MQSRGQAGELTGLRARAKDAPEASLRQIKQIAPPSWGGAPDVLNDECLMFDPRRRCLWVNAQKLRGIVG